MRNGRRVVMVAATLWKRAPAGTQLGRRYASISCPKMGYGKPCPWLKGLIRRGWVERDTKAVKYEASPSSLKSETVGDWIRKLEHRPWSFPRKEAFIGIAIAPAHSCSYHGMEGSFRIAMRKERFKKTSSSGELSAKVRSAGLRLPNLGILG